MNLQQMKYRHHMTLPQMYEQHEKMSANEHEQWLGNNYFFVFFLSPIFLSCKILKTMKGSDEKRFFKDFDKITHQKPTKHNHWTVIYIGASIARFATIIRDLFLKVIFDVTICMAVK